MSKNFDVIGIGETMLRLSVPTGEQLEATNKLDLSIGGAESNVLFALSSLGNHCSFVSSLPDSPLGEIVCNKLRQKGINTDYVLRKEGRIGTYYLEYASVPRASRVFYDRKDSLASLMKYDDFDWNSIMNCKVIHITGITVALSDACYELAKKVIEFAKSKNIIISFDVNYRSKLWSVKQAKVKLLEIIKNVDILFCSQRDAKNVFEINGNDQDMIYELKRISNAKYVISTISERGVTAILDNQYLKLPAYQVKIIDRVGAGDALAAGVIHGFLEGDLEKGLNYGLILAAMVMSSYGDLSYFDKKTLLETMQNMSADIQR